MTKIHAQALLQYAQNNYVLIQNCILIKYILIYALLKCGAAEKWRSVGPIV
jgi:hypothetical protein